jgi:predicted dienelactone hydrolase
MKGFNMKIRVNIIKFPLIAGLIISTLVSIMPSSANESVQLPLSMQPELAQAGEYTVGVTTLHTIHKNQLNIATLQLYDRPITLEIWYPADKSALASSTIATYQDVTRTHQPFSLTGKAFRDLPPVTTQQQFPLVVISHGYTGYRTLMYYLAEHLASNGYIVAAIDHTDSTNADVDMAKSPFSGFPSTLLNRARDQQFTLEYLTQQTSLVTNIIDKNKAGLIGYSMGGFGAVSTLGGCYHFTPASAGQFTGVTDPKIQPQLAQLLNTCAAGANSPEKADARWKAAMIFAPWGNQYGLFDDASLHKIKTPTLIIDGDLDDISDYSAVKRLFESFGSTPRYLLTYHKARHNIVPHQAPAIAYNNEFDLGHYYEPVWQNNVLQLTNKHFALAMMNCHIKQQANACRYLNLSGSSDQPMVNGKNSPAWFGFPDRFSAGMSWLSHQK